MSSPSDTPLTLCAPHDRYCPHPQVVYYVFAIIGMEVFQGRVHFDPSSASPDALACGNPALKDSAFAQGRYCRNNFNDLASSLVLLVELTVVNQWHNILSVQVGGARAAESNYGGLGLGSWKVGFLSFALIANGFALVTHQAAKLYFIVFHVVVVILIVK